MKRNFLYFFIVVGILLSLCSVSQAYSSNAQLTFITDEVGYLTEQDQKDLEAAAESAAEVYDCGMYFIIVSDFKQYASVQTLSEFADVVYDYYTLGIGSERNATLFVVCTLSEEYIISAYGPMATSAIGNAEAEQISDEVYKCLYDGRWYDAYANFLSYCKQYLSLCQETFVTEPEQTTNPVVPANPVAPASDAPAKNPRKFNGFLIIFIPLIVSIIVCLSMKGKMRTAIKQKKADDYIPCNGVTLTRQYENYLTTTREKKRR